MNQDSNNLNQNNYDTHGNNEITNQNNSNESLNNNVYQNQNYQQMPNNNQNIVSNNNNMPSKNKTPIIISIIVLILIIGIGIFAGIKIMSLNNETNNQKISSNNSVNENLNNNNQDNNDENLENSKVVRVPGNIYVNCSKDLRTKEQGRTTLMYNSKDKLVGLTFNASEEYSGDLNGVVDFLSEKFLLNIENYQHGGYEGSKILIESSSKTKINGFDSLKFEGKALNKSHDGEWDSFVYGYAFIINDIPVAVIGIVSDKSQDVNMINETRQNVDSIAATIRTEK